MGLGRTGVALDSARIGLLADRFAHHRHAVLLRLERRLDAHLLRRVRIRLRLVRASVAGALRRPGLRRLLAPPYVPHAVLVPKFAQSAPPVQTADRLLRFRQPPVRIRAHAAGVAGARLLGAATLGYLPSDYC